MVDKEKLTPHITLRDATLDDVSQIKELLIASWVEHAQNEPEMLDEARMRRSNIEDYYKQAIANPNSFIRIAEINSILVGFVRVDIKEEKSFFKYPKTLWIDDVVVVERFKQQGIGDFLIKEVERIAHKQHIEQIQARVYSYNHPMQHILEANGYHPPHALWVKTLK